MNRSAQERFLAVESLDASLATELADAPADEPIKKPDELSWWDWAVFLLHTVAEIEHALMVQYLYAAYSLASANFTGADVPPDAAHKTDEWRRTIVTIAKEEMGHLLTEQNLLRFIGGPLNFEREDFPFRPKLYPFHLVLEPLTKTSLAKYISAEMPAHPTEPEDEIAEIVQLAKITRGMRPNRVGVLFEMLEDIFSDTAKIADSDLRPETATGSQVWQASKDEWPGAPDMIVLTAKSRDEAITALKRIGEQGEGSADQPDSHFKRFLAIYREFPEPAKWVPHLPVPTNPTTRTADVRDISGRSSITNPTTRLWAQLFNVHYRMLLTDLAHALFLPLTDEHGNPTPRGQLHGWALKEMTAGVRGIADRLTKEPLAAPEDPERAGAPFELPYTFAIPDIEQDRWRLHGALLDASAGLVKGLQDAGVSGPPLGQIIHNDSASRDFLESLHPHPPDGHPDPGATA